MGGGDGIALLVFASSRFRDLERVMDVIEMAVRDQHEVADIHLFQGFRCNWVVHDPGIDLDDLSLRAVDLPGSVANPREADFIVERHTHPPCSSPR